VARRRVRERSVGVPRLLRLGCAERSGIEGSLVAKQRLRAVHQLASRIGGRQCAPGSFSACARAGEPKPPRDQQQRDRAGSRHVKSVLSVISGRLRVSCRLAYLPTHCCAIRPRSQICHWVPRPHPRRARTRHERGSNVSGRVARCIAREGCNVSCRRFDWVSQCHSVMTTDKQSAWRATGTRR